MSDKPSFPPADRFDVSVNGITYTFKMPSIKFDVEMSYKAHEARRRAYPDGGGNFVGADGAAYSFSRAVAAMELYLVAATDAWPWTKDAQTGLPVIDFEKFTPNRIDTIHAIGAAFETEYGRFRGLWNTDGQPASQENMAGGQNTGT